MTGESLDVIARNVGLLFQGLTAGGEVGEATNMLQQTVKGFAAVKGEITDTVAAMRKGDRAFMSTAEALKLIQKGFVETKGGMADLANSFGGKASTMLGHLDLLRVAFGTGINRGLAEGLDAMNTKLPEWLEASKALGDSIGLGIAEAIKGNTELLELQMAFLMQKLAQIGGAVFVQALGGVFRTLIPDMIEKLHAMPGFKEIMIVANPAGLLTGEALKEYGRSTPQVPIQELIEAAGEVVGLTETAAKLEALLKETKMTNLILSNTSMKHDKEGAVNAVYESLVYIK